MLRKAEIKRYTNETKIDLSLNIDGKGEYDNNTGCGFLNHMLDLFARHGRFDLKVRCAGDVEVDYHHTAEDIGIVLGQAFKQALGDMKGIFRYGCFALPMDEALVLCAIDISGRTFFNCDVQFLTEKVGEFDTELVCEFFWAFSRGLNATVHFKKFQGENSHHIAEAMFKGFGRVMNAATSIEELYRDEIPSTKGVI